MMMTTINGRYTMSASILAATGAMLLSVLPAAAATLVQHAGSVASIDGKRDIVAIDETGPWHGPSTRPVRLELHLTPATKITMVERANEPGGFAGAFVERPIPVFDIRPGDWANVTMTREGGRLTVTSLEIVRPPAAAGAARVSPRPHA